MQARFNASPVLFLASLASEDKSSLSNGATSMIGNLSRGTEGGVDIVPMFEWGFQYVSRTGDLEASARFIHEIPFTTYCLYIIQIRTDIYLISAKAIALANRRQAQGTSLT